MDFNFPVALPFSFALSTLLKLFQKNKSNSICILDYSKSPPNNFSFPECFILKLGRTGLPLASSFIGTV